MQVVLHAGAHLTDEDRLINSLLNNTDALAEQGTLIPSPGRYRRHLRDIMKHALKTQVTQHLIDETMEVLLPDIMPERLILSIPGFFGTPKMAASGGIFYSSAERRLAIFKQIFAGHDVELFLAIRNPASFLPAMFERTQMDSFINFLQGAEPISIRWSDMFNRIRAHHPDLPMTVWCNEDTPLLWSQLLREIAGIDPTLQIDGEYSLLEEIMNRAGMKRFRAYLASHPQMTEVQKRRVIAAFLDKFAEETAIEEEWDVPGWTDLLIDDLTERYDEDIFDIRRIPGLNMITP